MKTAMINWNGPLSYPPGRQQISVAHCRIWTTENAARDSCVAQFRILYVVRLRALIGRADKGGSSCSGREQHVLPIQRGLLTQTSIPSHYSRWLIRTSLI
ncbi:hypothetical protein E1B28_011379 [Marasmius oreades]|uniref:Uncharacterized protein n=1 Tax=Marasmius oreades TaxID=181124 RepID=A0A9P7RTY7_9AGAR|nr:uncharacterized protein E1B28_011379 [Marasmius oreades]KAG7089724.1 hypothetical protein E1B28_011379 [Marasmius oreades]